MTKDEARREVVRRWRELPIAARQTHQQLERFAQMLATEVPFDTLADRRRLIEAWLVKDVEHRDAVLQQFDAKNARTGQPATRR